MKDLESGDLHIRVSASEGKLLRLDWIGKSNARQPGSVLGPFLSGAANAALTQQATLEMHFERLEYFNSSTMTALIQFIHSLPDLKLKTKIVFDESLSWQRSSFEALRVFEQLDGFLSLESA